MLKKMHWKVDLSRLRYDYTKYMFVNLLIELIGPTKYVHYWVWSSL